MITNANVFDFMGTPDDIRETQSNQITNLIAGQTALFEQITGRKFGTNTFSDIFFYDGYNCEIYGNKMYLTGIYRDLLTVTAISEEGTALELATSSSSNGYLLNLSLGIIERIGSGMLKSELAYKISGTCGLITTDAEVIIIEMVSAKSGLWKSNVQTEDGTISTVRTQISKDTQSLLERYSLRGV